MRGYLGTGLILIAIAATYGMEVAMGVVANDDGLIGLGALPDTASLNGEYWRWLSFGFLHWDLGHLFLNTFLLLVAGPVAERRAGSIWLLFAFCAASMASGIAISVKHFLWPSQGASVGASGGMFGLLGFALVLLSFSPPGRPMTRILLGIAVSCGFVYSLRPGVSMIGHATGFVLGVFVALLVPRVGRARLEPDV